MSFHVRCPPSEDDEAPQPSPKQPADAIRAGGPVRMREEDPRATGAVGPLGDDRIMQRVCVRFEAAVARVRLLVVVIEHDLIREALGAGSSQQAVHELAAGRRGDASAVHAHQHRHG